MTYDSNTGADIDQIHPGRLVYLIAREHGQRSQRTVERKSTPLCRSGVEDLEPSNVRPR